MFGVINDRKATSNWAKPEREFTSRGKWLDTWIQTTLGPGLHLSSVLCLGFLLRRRVVLRQLPTATEQHPLGSSVVTRRGRPASSELQQKSRCISRPRGRGQGFAGSNCPPRTLTQHSLRAAETPPEARGPVAVDQDGVKRKTREG